MRSIEATLFTRALIDLPAASLVPLALLVVTPLLLWGADLFFDEVFEVRDELRDHLAYRSLLYIGVTLVGAFIITQTRESPSALESFRITAGSLLWVLLGILGTYIAIKWSIRRSWESERRKRIERIELELPQYLEMFYILITSGMSVLSALKVLGERGDADSRGRGDAQLGDFAQRGKKSMNQVVFAEFVRDLPRGISSTRGAFGKGSLRDVITEVLKEVEAGRSIENSIDVTVMSTGSEQLRRFSDAVILGMERGSSMGQSLRNLISETRNQAKVLVMQRAGKAEIQLLIPVVFLILPISVMFAIWPSYVNLISIMG